MSFCGFSGCGGRGMGGPQVSRTSEQALLRSANAPLVTEADADPGPTLLDR